MPDWVEIMTEDGRQYYHNTATDETSWERPVAAGSELGVAQGGPLSKALL